MNVTKAEKLFYRTNLVFLLFVAFLCAAPMLHILAISLSANDAVTTGQVSFWPKKFTLIGYEYIMENPLFWRSMWNSVVRVAVGVLFILICSALAAYPLSKSSSRFRLRTVYAWIFFLTMVVQAGMIPAYVVMNELGLIDSMWSLILPKAVTVFFILVLINFFRQIPPEMEEATLMDGGGQWTVLFKVFVPLSKPAFATLAVFAILDHWNSWFDGMIYLSTPDKFPLLTYLQNVTIRIDLTKLSEEDVKKMSQIGTHTHKAAQIFIASLPVMLSYPFLQKYFTKGLILGGVKG